MSVAEIKQLLSNLEAAQEDHRTAAETWPGRQRLELLTEQVTELEAQRATYLEDRAGVVAYLEASIKDRVLALGETVKSDTLMAVWTKPRVSWDGKLLEDFATAHPEILPFRHIGQPSVSIRPVRRDSDAER